MTLVHVPVRDYLAIVERPSVFLTMPASYRLAKTAVERLTGIAMLPRWLIPPNGDPQRAYEDGVLLFYARRFTRDPIEAHRSVYELRRSRNQLAGTVWFQRSALERGLEDRARGTSSEEAVMVRALELVLKHEPAFPMRTNARS